MILDKCKNCKHYKPHEIKVKSNFSDKVKTKYLRQGTCDIRILSGGMYRRVNDYGWCEKYERKTKKKNNEHNEHLVYNYTCPACHEILSNNEDCNYCPTCGTKLDWSQNEK